MHNQKVLESVRKMLNSSINRNGFDKILEKVNIISAGNGRCLAEMIVDKEHTNDYGTLHGGFTATVVDIISSIAIITHSRVVDSIDSKPVSGVSVDLHVTYIASAKIGDEVVIEAETVKLGRNLAMLNVLLCRKDNNAVIARGSHTKFVDEKKHYLKL